MSPPALLELVRARLAQVEMSEFDRLRRWDRKPVLDQVPIQIDELDARIVDLSYGGLRIEVPRTRDEPPPPSLNLRLASGDISVRADIVWHTALGEEMWLCGAALSQTSPAVASEWRSIVDAIGVR